MCAQEKNMERKAVITGMGMVTPLGIGKEENWKNLISGKSGIGPISRFDPRDLSIDIAGEVKDFKASKLIKYRKAVKLSFHSVHLAVVAAQLAMEDSGIKVEEGDPSRFGCFIGSGGGGYEDGPGFPDLVEPLLKSWSEEKKTFDPVKFGAEGIARTYPLFLLKTLPNNAFYYISLMFNIQGENDNIIASFTGGSQAIGDAARAIKRGATDVALAGGYDSLLLPATMFSFNTLELLSKNPSPAEACRPFDAKRDGMVLGEGAGMVMIEEMSRARKRGATIYAEISGYSSSSSAHHLYRPSPTGNGISVAVKKGLNDAKTNPSAIDYINADGIGTVLGDKAETLALKNVFGSHAHQIPISSTKSMMGHIGTGAGAVELIISALAMRDNILPPTINYETKDPECDLDYIPNQARDKEVTTALSINQGLGGQCACLVIKKVSGP
jgi:3-oxoacyl-(acyl-carrier-protein) synthase